MPPGRKEKDVLARQKQLAAMMAAKRNSNLTSSKNDAQSRKRSATASTSSQISTNKRPRIRGRPSKPTPPSS